jgi:hypothetical protein
MLVAPSYSDIKENSLRDAGKAFFLLRIRIQNGCRVVDPDPYGSAFMLGTRSGSALEGKVCSGSRLNSKFRTFRLRLTIEPWRALDAHNRGIGAKI